jgi:sugar O-acyltransferase (sialic acid O-acetyltransferase NeuD family)|tara:strand:- start:1838 stop:2446 length:609 start_codon:yes stop_codon:yes gene_type:complete
MHTESSSIVGAGGHAKVVFEAMQVIGINDVMVWDEDPSLEGKIFLDTHVRTLLDIKFLSRYSHIAIGDSKMRLKLTNLLLSVGKEVITVIHPEATVSKYSFIKAGCFIAAKSVVAPSSRLGAGVIVNHGAIIDHDCNVGAFSHIAPHATLGGGVTIGDCCLIGSGAVVLPGLIIGNSVTVGAGAVVVSNIKEGRIVYGVPAK